MKAVILILDGVGVGSGGVQRPPGPDTLGHTALTTGMSLPTFARLGLGNIAPIHGVPPAAAPSASYARIMPRYHGADSYLGHQEILGVSPPRPRAELLADSGPRVRIALEQAGYAVTQPLPGHHAYLVDDDIIVGDNLEAEPGAAVNLLVPTAALRFDIGVQVGRVVRHAVGNSRVIVCGGANFTAAEALTQLQVSGTGQVGVPTPSINLYDATYQVRHLGLPVDAARQLPDAFAAHRLPVALFGKVADLAGGRADVREPTADTAKLMHLVATQIASWEDGLIVTTVQETDLAGHEQDPERMARVLGIVDSALPGLLDALRPGDVLAITADHGNDPTAPDSGHTREYVPLLWHQPGRAGRNLGARSCLADVPASIADAFGFPWPGDGETLDAA